MTASIDGSFEAVYDHYMALHVNVIATCSTPRRVVSLYGIRPGTPQCYGTLVIVRIPRSYRHLHRRLPKRGLARSTAPPSS
jgi:hypothetical protein